MWLATCSIRKPSPRLHSRFTIDRWPIQALRRLEWDSVCDIRVGDEFLGSERYSVCPLRQAAVNYPNPAVRLSNLFRLPFCPFHLEDGSSWLDGGSDSGGSLACDSCVPIALLLWMVFPPRKDSPRVEIRHDRMGFYPSRLGRRFVGEEDIELTIPPESREILISRNSVGGLFDGYRVIVCEQNESQREVKSEFFRRIGERQWQQIAEGIGRATGLPVRMIVRRRPTGGPVEEVPWIVSGRKATLLTLGALITAASPYVAGIAVGILSPRIAITVAVGVTLWLCQMIALYASARKDPTGVKPSILFPLTSIFTFGAAYSFTVVVTTSCFGPTRAGDVLGGSRISRRLRGS